MVKEIDFYIWRVWQLPCLDFGVDLNISLTYLFIISTAENVINLI